MTRRQYFRIIFALALLWSIYTWFDGGWHPSGLTHSLGRYALALLIAEIAFISGMILMFFSVNLKSFGEKKRISDFSINKIRQNYPEIARATVDRSRWRFGFFLNWFGAIASTMVLSLAVIFLTPIKSWGLLIPFTLDLVATCGLRYPIYRNMSHYKNVGIQ